MRDLYQVIESILDTDQEVSDQSINAKYPIVIIKYLKQLFNENLEPESNVKKIDDWYPLGSVDDALYDKENITKTDRFVLDGIKNMQKNIKREIPKAKIDLMTNKDIGRTYYIKRYKIFLFTDEYNKYLIDMTLKAKKEAAYTDIENIFIWTKNKELQELL